MGAGMSDKETAYELKADSGVTSTDGVHFGGVPGVYRPGEPVAVSDMGLTPGEAATIVKDQAAPLKKTQAAPKGLLTTAESDVLPTEPDDTVVSPSPNEEPV